MSNQKAFTLIELLIAIVITGLFASIVMVNLNIARYDAKWIKNQQTNSNFYQAMGAYAIGAWSFEQITSPSFDSSGFGNNGVWNGGVTSKTEAECGSGLGRCMEFDGVDDYIAIADSNQLTFLGGEEFSTSVWIKADVINDYDGVIGKWNNINNREWLFRFGISSTFEFRLFDENIDNTIGRYTSQTINVGEWNHVVGTHNGSISDPNGGTRIYINGVRADVGDIDAVSGSYSGMENLNGELRVGNIEGVTENNFDGLIDEVAIFDQALTAGQVQKMYAEGLKRHTIAQQ